MKDTRWRTEAEMAKGLVKDNQRFAAGPIGLELAIGIVLVALVIGAVVVRLLAFG
jgi:hypothetical protein